MQCSRKSNSTPAVRLSWGRSAQADRAGDEDRLGWVGQVLGVAVGYILVGEVGWLLGQAGGNLLCPPAGVALAAPLAFGARIWPGVFLGALVHGWRVMDDPMMVWLVAAGNTLEGLVGAWLTERFAGGITFYRRPGGVLRFALLAGVLSPLLCPPFGVVDHSLGSLAFWNQDASKLALWWLGEMASVVLITPLFLLGCEGVPTEFNRRERLEFGGLLSLLAVVGVGVCVNLAPDWLQACGLPCFFLVIPLWAALRLGRRATTLAACAQALVAWWGTGRGHGFWGRTVSDRTMLLWQGVTVVNSMLSLFVSALVTQRREAKTRLGRGFCEQERPPAGRRGRVAPELGPGRCDEAQSARDVLEQWIDAQEVERQEIARELHNEMGQNLATLKLGLRLHRDGEALSQAARQTVEEMEQLTDQLMKDIHRLAWQLRPPVLDDFGLVLALQRYTEEWSRHSGIAVDFRNGLTAQRLPFRLETTLYRVTQEALTNVLKHAKARHVQVVLEPEDKEITLRIKDDGRGFHALDRFESRSPTGKMGLLGMQERVMFAGGQLRIRSAAGAGTTVSVRVPFESFSLSAAGPISL